MSIERYVATTSDLPPKQPGASVPATRRVASGTPVVQTPGGATAGVTVRDLPHRDVGLAIIWRAELRGALHTLQEAPAQIDPSSGNAWLLNGGSTTLLAPPPVPASQRLPGVVVRPRSAVVWIIARRPYTIGGPILWNTRYIRAQREVLTPGDPPVPEIIDYAKPETGPPPATPFGQWDTLRFTWFESLNCWSAEVITGNVAEQEDLELIPPEREPGEDDQSDNDYTGDGNPYNPGDIARPPGADDPDDEYVDEDGNKRLRSSGRLFLLTSTSLYLLSGDGGRTWQRFTGPWSAGVAASVLGGVVHVVDSGGNLWISDPGATAWTRAPRGVQLTQTEAGGGNQLAVGLAGRIVIDGAAAREGDTPLGSRLLTSLAYRRPSRGGADAWKIADERRGSLNGARHGIVVNRIEDTSTGTQFWVGDRAENPTIPAGTYRIVFDRTFWLDGSNNVWKPQWPNHFLTDTISWPGGSALDYARAIADAINPSTRQFLTGPFLPVPANVSASAEWIEYPDNTRRARLTILWRPRPPAPGEYPREFRPYERLRLDGGFGLRAVSGEHTDAHWNATTTIVSYEGNINAATPRQAPNSDSFALLEITNSAPLPGQIALVNHGTITITAFENTAPGWTPAGPRPPAEDFSRSKLDVEIQIASQIWRGSVGGDGLPVEQRPIVDGRINGPVSVQLFPVAGPFDGPVDTVLTVTFPAGWRVPIDSQFIQSARPWRGQAIVGSNASSPVPLTYRSPRPGAWMIAAADGRALFATTRGSTLTPGNTTNLPAMSGPVVATRDKYCTLSVVNGQLRQSFNDGPERPDLWEELQIGSGFSGPLPAYGASPRWVLAILPDGTTLMNNGFESVSSAPSVLSGRGIRISSINYRAGRWWAVERNTNRVYWSNNGTTWYVLPPLDPDVQAVEVEGE